MSLEKYQQLLETSPERTAVAKIKEGSNIPAIWPFLYLETIQKTKDQAIISITDTQTTALCQITKKETIEKLEKLSPHEIIYLKNSKITKKDGPKIEINIDQILTLEDENLALAKRKEPIQRKKVKINLVSTEKPSSKALKTRGTEEKQEDTPRTLLERWQSQGKNLLS